MKGSQSQTIFEASITNTKLVIRPVSYELKHKTSLTNEFFKNIGSKKISGQLQRPAQRKIEKYLDLWYKSIIYYNKYYSYDSNYIPRRFVMITITLASAQVHTDQELKLKILKPFIQQLNRKYQVDNWIWKAEKQKNGNIHFHIVIDKFVPYTELYDIAYYYQQKTGYIKRFKQRHPGKKPPLLNVKGQKEIKNPVNYITKYIAKNEESKPVAGAIWRASNKLVNIKEFKHELSSSECWTISKYLQNKSVAYYSDTYYEVFCFKNPLRWEEISTEASYNYRNYLRVVSDYLYLDKANPIVKANFVHKSPLIAPEKEIIVEDDIGKKTTEENNNAIPLKLFDLREIEKLPPVYY